MPSCRSPFSIEALPFYGARDERLAVSPLGWELRDPCQAGEIHVLGCDQRVQKLSTEKILYTCNKLG